VPILLYHEIGVPRGRFPRLFVDPKAFELQMAALAESRVTTLTMEDLVQAVRAGRSFPSGAIAVTFDDGTEDQYAIAYPILRRFGIKASLFVPTGRVGRPGHLTWAQLKQMSSSGLIAVEAHTITHRDLNTLDDATAYREIAGSRAAIMTKIGGRVSAFAYPFGHLSPRIERLVERAGFSCAVTTQWRWAHSAADEFEWGRLEIHSENRGINLADLARQSGGWVSVAPRRLDQKR